MSISIDTAILWKETKKKIRYSQEIGLMGALQSRAQKKGSRTLALDNHTWDEGFSDDMGGLAGVGGSVPAAAMATWHLLVQNHSLHVGPPLSTALL